MSTPWDGFAKTVLDQFDEGYNMSRQRGLDAQLKARQAKQDEIAQQERDYRTTKDSRDMMFRDKMQANTEENQRLEKVKEGLVPAQSQTEAMLQDQVLKDKLMKRNVEQATIHHLMEPRVDKNENDNAALKAAESVRKDVTAREAAYGQNSMLSNWMGWGAPEISPEDVQNRKKAQEFEMSIMRDRMSKKAGGGAPRDPKTIYIEARRAGKSEQEAKQLASGGK